MTGRVPSAALRSSTTVGCCCCYLQLIEKPSQPGPSPRSRPLQRGQRGVGSPQIGPTRQMPPVELEIIQPPDALRCLGEIPEGHIVVRIPNFFTANHADALADSGPHLQLGESLASVLRRGVAREALCVERPIAEEMERIDLVQQRARNS